MNNVKFKIVIIRTLSKYEKVVANTQPNDGVFGSVLEQCRNNRRQNKG